MKVSVTATPTDKFDGNDDVSYQQIVITIDNPPKGMPSSIMRWHLKPAIELFLKKAADYGDDDFHTADLLGSAGQFAELWRKMGKLYRFMWKGDRAPEFEDVREILMDMFGHILLSIEYYNKENK